MKKFPTTLEIDLQIHEQQADRVLVADSRYQISKQLNISAFSVAL